MEATIFYKGERNNCKNLMNTYYGPGTMQVLYVYYLIYSSRKARTPGTELLLLITLPWLRVQNQEVVAIIQLGRAWTRGVVAEMRRRRRIQVIFMELKFRDLGDALGAVDEEILESKKTSGKLWRGFVQWHDSRGNKHLNFFKLKRIFKIPYMSETASFLLTSY